MKESYFDGTIWQLIGHGILAGLLTVVTFGIGYPWALCILQRWETKHTVIESKRLSFDGKGLQLLGKWIVLAIIPFGVLIAALVLVRLFAETKAGSFLSLLISLLLIVGVFLYGPFVAIEMKKWTVKHIIFESHFSPDINTSTVPNTCVSEPPAPESELTYNYSSVYQQKVFQVLDEKYLKNVSNLDFAAWAKKFVEWKNSLPSDADKKLIADADKQMEIINAETKRREATPEKPDWTEKISKFMPLIYVLEALIVIPATWFILSLIFL